MRHQLREPTMTKTEGILTGRIVRRESVPDPAQVARRAGKAYATVDWLAHLSVTTHGLPDAPSDPTGGMAGYAEKGTGRFHANDWRKTDPRLGTNPLLDLQGKAFPDLDSLVAELLRRGFMVFTTYSGGTYTRVDWEQ